MAKRATTKKAASKRTTTRARKPLRIIVGHRGWVHVGRIASTSPTEVVIEGARCVRRWGTTNGLLELATNGPTANTKLDAPGTLRLHPMAIMHQYDCTEASWANASK